MPWVWLPEIRNIQIEVSLVAHFETHDVALKELADVEEDWEGQQGADVANDPVLVGGGVLLPAPVVQWMVDSHEPLQGDPDRHVDGAHQGDWVQGVEEVGGEDDVSVCLETELPEGLQQHGQQVDEVKDGKSGDELVEWVSHWFAEEQEDRNGVANNSERAYH